MDKIGYMQHTTAMINENCMAIVNAIRSQHANNALPHALSSSKFPLSCEVHLPAPLSPNRLPDTFSDDFEHSLTVLGGARAVLLDALSLDLVYNKPVV